MLAKKLENNNNTVVNSGRNLHYPTEVNSKSGVKHNNEPSSRWVEKDEDIVGDFDKKIRTLDYALEVPWEKQQQKKAGGVAFSSEGRMKDNSKEYKYQSLWEPKQLTDKKLTQIKNYNYDPPYQCDFNVKSDNSFSHRRFNSDNINHTKTISPWEQGKVSSDPHKGIAISNKATTSLWDSTQNSKIDSEKSKIILSGDPILDNLRAQLYARGSTGITGLAKRFKSMDDDGRSVNYYRRFQRQNFILIMLVELYLWMNSQKQCKNLK